MTQQQIFKCQITKYVIEFAIDNEKKNAYLNLMITDYQHLKPLFSLLRTSIDSLTKNGINTISQTVSKEEWELYLENKTTWKIIRYDQYANIYDLECDIDCFLENFGIGIGLFS